MRGRASQREAKYHILDEVGCVRAWTATLIGAGEYCLGSPMRVREIATGADVTQRAREAFYKFSRR